MTVNFKGGTSGSRGADFSPPVPSSGSPQPIQYTQTSGPIPSTVHLQADNFEQSHFQQATPDVPTGGTEATGSDLEQQDITGIGPTSGDESVFQGAPNTGLKGGPAVPGV